MGTVQLAFAGDRGRDRTIAHDQKWHQRKWGDFSPYFFPRPFFSHTFFPYFPPPRIICPVFFAYFFSILFSSYYFPVCFFSYFFSRTFFPHIFFLYSPPPYLFPVILFPYYFPALFQKSRRLKSNVLIYQLVVFLVHVVISQFMFLAE